MIGRWKPSADEGYERNVKTNVVRCQKVIAAFIPFDETTVIQLVEQRMKGMGYKSLDCDGQLMRLMSFMPGTDAAKPCQRPSWTTTGPVILVKEEEEETGEQGEKSPVAEVVLQDEGESEQEPTEVLPVDKVAGMFIVSIVGRSKTRTLHRIGECHRQPGLHYANFEILGEETPGRELYDRACKQCFREGGAGEVGALEDDSSGKCRRRR